MNCPKCNSQAIRSSHSTRFGDTFRRMLGRVPIRCRTCRYRFYTSSEALAAESQGAAPKMRQHKSQRARAHNRRRLMRRLTVAAIFLVAFVIFLVFLRYLTSEPGGSSDQGPASTGSSN